MAKPSEIKAELQKRHDAGAATGEDRLNLDAMELIEQLQAENERLRTAGKRLIEYWNKPTKQARRGTLQSLMEQLGIALKQE